MEKRHLLSTEKHSGDEDAYFFMIENMFAIGKESTYMPRVVWLLIIGQFILMTGSSFLWPLNSI